MKAVVKQKRGDGFVGLVEVGEPTPGPGEVLVRVGSAGICGSDINILHGRFRGYKVPVTLGHEFAGVVEDPNSTAFSKGERVACETHAYVCGACEYCRAGTYNLCPRRKGFGYGADGAFAKYVSVRQAIVHPLPDEVSTEEGALLEPLAVAVNALTVNSRISRGDTVVILGPGPIGLLCLQMAKLLGARATVVGTKKSASRLKLAEKLGAQTMTDDELEAELHGTAGRYDVAVIAAGRAPAFELALRAAKPAGRVVQIGESTERAQFQYSLIEEKNLTVSGSFSHNWPVWERAISLVKEGKVAVKPLVTHRVTLERWKEGFDAAEQRSGVKVLIKP